MKKLQYSIFRRDTRNASGKAKWDASDILLDMGFNELYSPSRFRPIRVAQQLVHTLAIGGDSLLAVQYPANKALFYKILAAKHVRSFALIHDLESLRLQTDIQSDVAILSSFEGIISHNAAMTKALRNGGFEKPVVDLGLFDYLGFEGDVSGDRDQSVVAFAGNLSKAGFLEKLQETGLRVNLYGGPEPDAMMLGDRVHYMGSFPSNDVPGKIAGGWGLVWDGDSTDTCTGQTGEYLKYNCPHKASMYVIAERPLIVWKESALAPYVTTRGIGIAVGSLSEARDRMGGITSGEYASMVDAVRDEKAQISTGQHLEMATERLLNMIGTN